MSNTDALFAELQVMGAGEFKHLNGSLAAHLRGTEALLRAWGAREALCLAGLYHAAYGTDGYQPALVSVGMRPKIAALIGEDAEEIAYLYGACLRQVYYPRIGTNSQHMFADRFSDSQYEISVERVCDITELILANELEIASGSLEFRVSHGKKLSELFERMRAFVSPSGFEAYRQILASAPDRQ